jgi:hypothetical protein
MDVTRKAGFGILMFQGVCSRFEKLAEIFGLNQMKNSDQRWVLA